MVYQGGFSATNFKRFMMVKLHQSIDTLKLHLYPSHLVSGKDIEGYNALIDTLLSAKFQAKSSKNENKSFAQYQHNFKGQNFQVMPSTVRGFSVTIQNADISIHLKKLQITIDQNPFCKVEFRASFLQRFGYLSAIKKVQDFLTHNIISNYTIKISEIHLQCDVQGYTFSILDFHRTKTRARNNRYYDDEIENGSAYNSGRNFQGFMKGGGDYLMRVYNKTKEIKKFPNKAFIQGLWNTNLSYDETKEVFRIEFQIRREKLKNMVIDGQVLDGFEVVLNNLNNLWGRCLEDFSLRDMSDDDTLELLLGYKKTKSGEKKILTFDAVRQRFLRSDIHPLWKVIETFNGHYKTDTIETFVKPFTTDFIYVHNAFKAFLSTTLSHFGDIRPCVIEDAMNKIKEYTLKKHEKTVLEDVFSKRIDRFNRLIIKDKDERLYNDKHYFVNRIFDTIDETYNAFYDDGVGQSDVYIKKFSKFIEGA